MDRLVLNAYFTMGQEGGGFRTWWRQLHNGSEDELDNTHLMRMAGRFARRVRSWANANGIPLIDCGRGERKHLTLCGAKTRCDLASRCMEPEQIRRLLMIAWPLHPA